MKQTSASRHLNKIGRERNYGSIEKYSKLTEYTKSLMQTEPYEIKGIKKRSIAMPTKH